ncbi:hypothetical protein [Herbaspirillum robiniae]|uniref:Restriction endonuclease type IV Mrr domain-containing protein n=1 Tax=Herbaspirillum robiniae TaxID=2014887 RepID=A0ABX2M3K2_9BURK|nr:hypothetical protein [Herbaspirillum robiniae]NUU04589.1 hypothetical protein [Herbaspirillum robiniae]
MTIAPAAIPTQLPFAAGGAVPVPVGTTLEDMIAYVAREGIDDARIWGHLDATDGAQLLSLLDQLDLVDAEKFDPDIHVSMKPKQFAADQSARKGALFERITYLLLNGVRCFQTLANITTATNQLDVLVKLNPTSSIIPALRGWGEFFICECKFHDKGVDNTWLHKLKSILDVHGAKVGILIAKKGLSRTGRGGNQHHLVQLMAAHDRYILVFSRAELRQFAQKGKVLEHIIDKFITSKLGIPALLKE